MCHEQEHMLNTWLYWLKPDKYLLLDVQKCIFQACQSAFTYLKLQLKRACNCCLQGPLPSLVCEQEHLEKSPSESSAKEKEKKKKNNFQMVFVESRYDLRRVNVFFNSEKTFSNGTLVHICNTWNLGSPTPRARETIAANNWFHSRATPSRRLRKHNTLGGHKMGQHKSLKEA